MSRFILASASPRRSELLHQVGMEFEVIKSDIEEIVTKTNPAQVVMELSLQKATDVYNNFADKSDVVVIAADTIVYNEGKVLGKPQSESEARDMIESISGHDHEVYTGVAVIFDNQVKSFYEMTKVNVYPMSKDDILSYVKTGESIDKAGAYGIQGRFAAYIKGIEGDYNNVVGLPVGRLCYELRKDNII